MTTLENVTLQLNNIGIRTSGVYETLPQTVLNQIINVLHFGENVLERSSLSSGIKALIIRMATEDGRSCVICERTFKTILV